MYIRPVNLDDSAELHTFHGVFRASESVDNPDRPVWPEAQMISHLTEPTDDEAVLAFTAFDDSSDSSDSTMLGAAFMFYPLLDNTTKAYMHVFVDPAHQGHGVGSALLDHVVTRAAADGRTILLANANYAFDRRDDHPYRRFAERHGFTAASTEISRRLDLPVPDEQIQAWVDEAAPHHADYRIQTFIDEVPDELLPSVCHVVNQLALDAPTGDIDFEAEAMTPEILRQREILNRKTGLRKYETVAIDATGEAVAVTTIGIPDGDPGKAHQWATIVMRGHRGHRLGLALKARNLRAVQQDHPDRKVIFTCNSEENGYMVDINERMGFKKFELMVSYQRKLEA